jgi:DNA-binding MarR family transcriptional regulator
MKHTQAQPEPEPVLRPADGAGAPQGLELRHLRYFVAVADAGSFTYAAERIFIAQPTLSQQIRRLEQIVGTPLLHRRREGLRLTPAGGVLLDASRNVAGHRRYRGDLRLLYFASLQPGTGTLAALQMAPMRARNLRLHRAPQADARWLRTVLQRTSSRFGSRVGLGPDDLLALRGGP